MTGDATHSPGGYGSPPRPTSSVSRSTTEGQALANVTLDSKVKGRARRSTREIAIEIDQARIELSEAKRKRLQALEVPPDVVLVEDGKPLNPAQAKRLGALKERRAASTASNAGRRTSRAAPTLRIKVNAPRQLWVTGKDAYLELGLSRPIPHSEQERRHPDLRAGDRAPRANRRDGPALRLQADSTLRWSGRRGPPRAGRPRRSARTSRRTSRCC